MDGAARCGGWPWMELGAGICVRTTPDSFFAGSFLLVHDASTTAAATTQSSAEVADPALLKVDSAAPLQDLR